jgi:hypothetical protein
MFDKKDKKVEIKKREAKVEQKERAVTIEENLDVAEIESIKEYDNGIVVLKYTNSKDEPCSLTMTRMVPEGGNPDLGPERK